MKIKRAISLTSIAIASVLFLSLSATAGFASTGSSSDFNTPGDLEAKFNSYIKSDPGTVSQSATGGISDSGSISAPGPAEAIFTTKMLYSLGPVGSSYTFSSFMKSVGGGGYGGMGFTALEPSSVNATTGSPFRPLDALGISVHGGGFIFHNGTEEYSGSWGQSSDDNITAVTSYPSGDLLGGGSPDEWYKAVLNITRDSETTFDMRIEIYISTADGVIFEPAAAIFELNNQSSPELLAVPAIAAYINFSGDRIYNFDNFVTNLSGGATTIEAGAPAVLTSGASESGNVVTVEGDVTDEGSSTVTERGFVYGTSADPTLSDSSVAVGAGAGAFTGETAVLEGGTYYFRAYATNASGTTYGAEEEVTLEVLAPSTATTAPEALSSTGMGAGFVSAAGGLMALIAGLGTIVAVRRRTA